MFKKLKNQKGLTLIELLAVLVIVGIVAAIAVPQITGVLNQSKVKADIANEKSIIDNAKRFLMDYENKSGVTAYKKTTVVTIDMNELVKGGYLTEAPVHQQTSPTQTYKYVALVKNDNGAWVTPTSDVATTYVTGCQIATASGDLDTTAANKRDNCTVPTNPTTWVAPTDTTVTVKMFVRN